MWLFTSFTILYHVTLTRIFIFSVQKMGGKEHILLFFGINDYYHSLSQICFLLLSICLENLHSYIFSECYAFVHYHAKFIREFSDGRPLRFQEIPYLPLLEHKPYIYL